MELGERLTAELWVEFGGQRRREERTRARRSELAAESSLRARFRRVEARQSEVDASTLSGRRRGGHARDEG